MSIRTALNFFPDRLHLVSDQVSKLHPNTAVNPRAVSGDLLESLVRRLRECSDNPTELAYFAANLTGREHRGLLSVLERSDPDLSRLIERALADHLHERSVPHLWNIWQRVPLDRVVLSMLRLAAETFGTAKTVEEDWRERVEGWLAGDPVSEIVKWMGGESIRVEDIPNLIRSPLSDDTPLISEIWRRVLTTGAASQLLNEDAGMIKERGFSLGPTDVQDFGRNYLVKVPPRQWDLELLKEIRRRYGLPDAIGSRPAFWDPVPDPPKGDFRQFFIKRELADAFGGGSDRHKYWEGWLKDMRDVTSGVAGATSYAIIEFSTFGVIEFFEVGNAAYFYASEEVARLKKVSPDQPSDLKAGSDRLIHSVGWEWRADRMIRKRLTKRRWGFQRRN